MVGTKTWRLAALGAVLGLTAAGCGDGNPAGPGGGNGERVSLSMFVPGSAGGSSVLAPSSLGEVTQSDGTNTLTITRVAMVLREIELQRVEADFCEDDTSGPSDDDCEEFEVGPRLFELPLNGVVEQVIAIDGVPAAAYDELEIEIHKPDDDTPGDLAFLQQHPDFRRVSIRVEGSFNGNDFLYLTDLNEEQETDLVPPLVVEEGAGPTNVTLSIDVLTWFVAPGGSLVNPATANKGGPNEQLVKDNIKNSIEGFEDSDRDGVDD